MFFLAILVTLATAVMLAATRASILRWAASYLVIGSAIIALGGNLLWLLPAVMLGALSVDAIRLRLLSQPVLNLTRKILPKVSQTEQEVLDAGTVFELLTRQNLLLQDSDLYEIHEDFAAQVLCTLKAWESDGYCQSMGAPAALGAVDPDRINLTGSSLALGHPFVATGARVIGTAERLLAQQGQGRALVSVCTAGGMGAAMILER